MSWRVQTRHQGRMMQATFEHEKGAREFANLAERVGWDAAKAVLDARRHKHKDVPTLAEWVAHYLDAKSGLLTGIEDGTRAGYRRAAERSFLKFLGEIPVDAITKADVGKWVEWQEQQPAQSGRGNVAMKTVQNYHSILSASMRAAVEQKLRDDNPAYKTRITRGTKREGVFLTPEEYATLLYFIPEKHQPLVILLAGTGLRWGEATALHWSAVDLNPPFPSVRVELAWKKGAQTRPVLKQPKSKRSRRTVSITPDIVAALGEPGPSNQLVFRGERSGTHLWHQRIRDRVWLPAVAKAQNEALCEAAGLMTLKKTPTIHDLRHTHASWLIQDGTPLPYVQARLGHESINTTIGTYGHLQPDAHAAMAESIQRKMAGTRPLKHLEN